MIKITICAKKYWLSNVMENLMPSEFIIHPQFSFRTTFTISKGLGRDRIRLRFSSFTSMI